MCGFSLRLKKPKNEITYDIMYCDVLHCSENECDKITVMKLLRDKITTMKLSALLISFPNIMTIFNKLNFSSNHTKNHTDTIFEFHNSFEYNLSKKAFQKTCVF